MKKKKLLGYTVNDNAPRIVDIADKLNLPLESLNEISSGELGNDIMFHKNSPIHILAKEKRVFTKWFKPVYSINND